MKKGLIVDDFVEYRYEYKAMLDDLYNVELAANLEEAKNKLNNSYHIAIIDINLDRFDRANKDGVLLAQWIKEKFPQIKILFVSAIFGKKEVEKAYDSFIQKPIIEDLLRREVEKLIGK